MGQEVQTEGTVEWKAAEDFFAGKAKEEEAAAAETAPEGEIRQADDGMVEVRIKGQKVKMTKEAADAYSEFVRETRERDGRLGGEIAQLRERSARLEGAIESVRQPARPTAGDEIKPPRPELAIENYSEYHRQMLEYNAAMMLMQREEIEQTYRKDQEQKQKVATTEARMQAWADKFYAEYSHLNKKHLRPVVLAAYQENLSEIQGYGDDIGAAHERLAELADERILAIRGEARSESQQTNASKPPRLEGSGTPSDGKTKSDKFVPVTGAAWVAKKRAALRGGK